MLAANEREVPRSLETEQALIGTVMMFPTLFEAVAWIRPTDFHEQIHSRLWECIQLINDEGRSPSPIAVNATMPPQDMGGGMTSQAYVARLAAAAMPQHALFDLAVTVRRFAQRRALLSVALDLTDIGFDSPIGARPADLAAGAIEALDTIVMDSGAAPARSTIGKAAEKAAQAAQNAAEGKQPPGITTGITSLDNVIGPMMGGDSLVMGGRPGMGKSAVALQIGLNVAQRGRGVLMFSLEMTDEQLAARALSNRCFFQRGSDGNYLPPIPYRNIRSGHEWRHGAQVPLTIETMERMWDAQSELARLPFEIDYTGSITLSQIVTRARRAKARMAAKGIKLGLIILDYLSLVEVKGREESRERQVAELSRGIKMAAKELDVPWITLAQLSRQIEMRKLEERRPQLHDLRESGAIEQDADVVLGLFRKEYYVNKDGGDFEELQKCKNHLEIDVLKGRNSGTNKALVKCFIASNAITEFAEQQDVFNDDQAAF